MYLIAMCAFSLTALWMVSGQIATTAASVQTPELNIPSTVLKPNASGEDVVDEVIELIHKSELFLDDHGFLKRIAIVESKLGRHPSTYKGVSGGIWQVDKIGLNDTQKVDSHPGLKRLFPGIMRKFGIDWPNVTFEDLRKPLYSGLAARIYLRNKPEAIPSTLEGQATYWKKLYNTGKGKGDEEKFIKDVTRCTVICYVGSTNFTLVMSERNKDQICPHVSNSAQFGVPYFIHWMITQLCDKAGNASKDTISRYILFE